MNTHAHTSIGVEIRVKFRDQVCVATMHAPSLTFGWFNKAHVLPLRLVLPLLMPQDQ